MTKKRVRLSRKEQRPRTESADATLHRDALCDLPQKSSAISNRATVRTGDFRVGGSRVIPRERLPLGKERDRERAAWLCAQGLHTYELSSLCELTKK